MSNKKFYNDINIARGIAIVLVVAGHSFPDADINVFNNNILYYYLYHFIVSFHMSLFFTISGFFFAKKFYSMKTVNQKLYEINKKIKRIIVPYLTISFITLLVKQFLSSYAYHKFDITDAWKILIGIAPNGGMWFLWTLFCITLIFTIFNKVNVYVLLAFSSVFYLLKDFIVYAGLNHIFYFCIYFLIGILINKQYERYYDKIKKIGYLLPAILFILLVITFYVNNVGDNILINIIIDYLGIFFTLTLSIQIDTKLNVTKKVFSKLGSFSYDIYLLSYFAQIPIRIVFYSILNIPYVLCILFMFISGLIMPFIISKYIMRKISIMNKLLLGNWQNKPQS